MAKILSAIPKTKEWEGKMTPFWEVAVQMSDGTMRGMPAYREMKMGDEIPDSEIRPGKKEGTWCIWGEKKGGAVGKQWVRNDELMVAQTVFRALVDLHIQGRIQMFDTDSDRYFQPNMTNLGTEMGLTIQNISRNLKGGQQCAQQSAPQQSTVKHPDPFDEEFPKFAPLKSIGDLCARGVDVYGKTMTLAKIVSILQAARIIRTADIKDVKNLDEAWEAIRANEESKKC